MSAVDAPGPASIRVEVAYSPCAGQVDLTELMLPLGATVDDALRASGVRERHGLDARVPVGVWGRDCEGSRVLRDQDRVELYRPLQVDPKEARRLRDRQQPTRPGRRVNGSPTR